MATPRYRIIDEKGAYMPRSPELHVLALGSDHASAAVYNIRAPLNEHLVQSTEIDFSGTPGPHLEPLNDEAREAMDAYWAKFPNASLDPTRHMPAGQDPMGGKSVEQLVVGLLEAMDQERAAAAPAAAVVASPELAAILAGQQATLEAIKGLTAALTALVVSPAAVAKGRAA